jgi:hypothetical protein
MLWGKILGNPSERSDVSQALTLGTTFAVGMAVFSFAGFKIDQRRGGGILFTLLGMFLGLAFGAYETWRVITFLNRQSHDRTLTSPENSNDKHSSDPSLK